MRQALTGWIVAAGCVALLGAGAVVGAQHLRAGELPAATVAEWRRYAEEVDRGARMPSAPTTRMLTETAIAQNAYAGSAVRLLRVVGAGVAVLGVLLALDLVRYRARYLARSSAPSNEGVERAQAGPPRT